MGVLDAPLKGGPNARQAAIAGTGIPFRTFLFDEYGLPAFTEVGARAAILAICGPGYGTDHARPLTSRRLLDHDPAAIDAWEKLQVKWGRWLRRLEADNGR